MPVSTSVNQKAAELSSKWNKKYEDLENVHIVPSMVLEKNAFLLPSYGRALDLACGFGGNAIFLARSGLDVEAWDVSTIALAALKRTVASENLNVKTRQGLVTPDCFVENQFDVIVVSRFLDRDLTDAIVRSLRPNGLVFYQTFTRAKVSTVGPKNPEYLLEKGELLDMFNELDVIFYRENGLIGDINKGLRNEAQLVSLKVVETYD